MARILVVDDDRVNRVLLTRFLENSQHEVALAESGERAIEVFSEFEPDVVLMDVIMPGIDGFETTRILKRMSGSRHVPVLLLTALADDDSLVRGISAGADDFVSKPVNRVVLNSRLHASLRTRRLFARLAQQHEELLDRQTRDDREQRLASGLMSTAMRSQALSHPALRSFSRSYSLFNGDILLAEETAYGGLRVLLGDFSGHGLHAAIGAMPVAAMFRQMTQNHDDLRRCLQEISGRLRESLPTDMFFAACALELDPSGDCVELWNCGMPDVLVRHSRPKDEILRRIPSSTVPLGIVPWRPEWQGELVELEPGDRLYMLSDGLIEVRDQDGREWGFEGVEGVLRRDLPNETRFETLLEARRRFMRDARENDDVTLVEVDPEAIRSSARSGRRECSRFEFELGAEALRRLNQGEFIEKVVSMLPLEPEARSHVGTITSELFVNAVDHGILGLQSDIKRDRDGFDAYQTQRSRALFDLRQGRVEIAIAVECDVEGDVGVRVRVRDSGPGFDVRTGGASESVPWGRGLTLVNELATRFTILGSGNIVEAEYGVRCDDGPKASR